MAAELGTPGLDEETANATSHGIALPATYNTGDLLLLLIACDGAPAFTVPSFWTLLDKEDEGTAVSHGLYYGFADGTEDDDLTWESTSEIATTVVYPVIGAHASQAPEVNATAGEGNSDTPDPPAVTPSWGAEAGTLFVVTIANDGNQTVATWPTNYDTNGANHGISGAGGARLGVSWRNATTTTEDPGAGELSGANNWVSHTIAIRAAAAGAVPAAGAAGVGLQVTATARKLASSGAAIGLGLGAVDGAQKAGQVAGQATLGLGVASAAVKGAQAAAQLTLGLGVAGAAEAGAPAAAAGVGLGLGVAGAARKLATSSGALGLGLGVAGAAQQSGGPVDTQLWNWMRHMGWL